MNIIKDFKTVKKELVVEQLFLKYEKQRQLLPLLPPPGDFCEIITTNITTIQKEGSGWAFYQNNQLQGILSGYKMDTLFGKAKGVYIPLYGHCIFAEDEEEIQNIYKKMYAYASAQWVKDGYLSHSITVYAKNRTNVETWFWLGFGNRCVDSIKPCEAVESTNKKIRIKKATLEDLETIAHLEGKNHNYFRTAPLFMPTEDTNPLESLKE